MKTTEQIQIEQVVIGDLSPDIGVAGHNLYSFLPLDQAGRRTQQFASFRRKIPNRFQEVK